MTTPFQKELVRCLAAYSAGGPALSGRQLSKLMGRSANHISQMLNDGLVPAGPSILEMAEVLELDREGTDRLVRAALVTKSEQRARDHFWIDETLRMLDEADRREAGYRAFLRRRGLLEACDAEREKRKGSSAPRSRRPKPR